MPTPQLVYVPAHPDPRADQRGLRFETRLSADGRPIAIGFTTRQRLVDACGPAQPWVCLPLIPYRGSVVKSSANIHSYG